MAVNCSTGFRSKILGPTSFESIFNGGCIEIRSGPQPISADAAATGELLGRITLNGDGWTAGSPDNGLLFVRSGIYAGNDPAQEWVLTGLMSGQAGWFRLVANGPDDGGVSSSLPRIDGAAGPLDVPGDYQMRLPSLSITESTMVVIPSWWFLLPPIT